MYWSSFVEMELIREGLGISKILVGLIEGEVEAGCSSICLICELLACCRSLLPVCERCKDDGKDASVANLFN